MRKAARARRRSVHTASAVALSQRSQRTRTNPPPLTAWWLAPLLIGGAAVALYANSFAIPFLLDDNTQIVRNPALAPPTSLWTHLAQVRGVLMLTLALNYRWGGLEVFGYHLVNLLVHIANGILVYVFVARTLRLPFFDGRYDRHAPALALVTSLVFVAHPLQTMSVSYIVQRAESLASLFYLLAMLLFLSGATAATAWRRALAYAGALAASLLGVLTKQIVATLPVMVLLYQLCFLRRASSARPAWHQWFAAALLFTALGVAVYVSRQYFVPVSPRGIAGLRLGWFIPTAGLGVEGVTPWRYLLTQFGVIVWYLRLYLLPTQLTFDYGWPLVDRFWRADVILPFAVLGAMGTAAIACARRYRLATFCLAWFFVVLAPSSSIVPLRDAAFEHRMYLPMLGLTWLAVVGAYDAAPRLARWTNATPGGTREVLALVAVAWLTFLGVATVMRNRVLQDPLLLAADSARKAPHNWRAHYDLGYRLAQEGQVDEAIDALEEAIRRNSREGLPRIELSRLLVARGRLAEAEAHLREALRASERSVVAAAALNMGLLRQLQGEWRQAIIFLGSAAGLMPDWINAHETLARVYEQHDYWLRAAEQYEAVARLDKASAAEHAERAAVNYSRAGIQALELGSVRAAVSAFVAAAKHAPDRVASYRHLALLYGALGEWEQAEEVIAAAARLAPDDPFVREDAERVRHRLAAPP